MNFHSPVVVYFEPLMILALADGFVGRRNTGVSPMFFSVWAGFIWR